MIGEFSSSDLPLLLERGEILPTDTCYIEETNEWQSISDYLRASELPKFRPAPEAPPELQEPSYSSSFFLGSVGLILLGVVLLLALAMVVGAGAWVHSLQMQLNSAEARVIELEGKLRYQPLAEKPEETQPKVPMERTKVIGQVTIRDENGQSKPLPGFYVDLYEEKIIRAYLLSRSLELAAYKQSKDLESLHKILNGLPSALRKTTTNSDGYYEFQLPREDRYVVYSSMTIDGPSGPEILLS